MSGFDTILVADWSAGMRRPARPSKDSIWLGLAQEGHARDPIYCRTRAEAEARIAGLVDAERAAGRRLLAAFDFPFGYPRGFARVLTGKDDPLALWSWVEARITDDDLGRNNRYDVAQDINALFDGPGPFWGKPNPDAWPGIPYRKREVAFDRVGERRSCDRAARTSSSCFQLAYPPTVGGQVLMGLPTLARLRRRPGVAAWPFEPWQTASCVLAEIWPGLIEPAVRAALAAAPSAIRDREQVRLLSLALSRLPAAELDAMLNAPPPEAAEEAWILGAGHAGRLTDLAGGAVPEPPPLRNDCFALPAGTDWTPVDTALAHLRDNLRPVTGVETVAIGDAAGRVLADDVSAQRSSPPQANTAVDGFGFAGPLAEGAHVLRLARGRAAAGAPHSGVVGAGMALRVLTGAALPDGVDTVILEEDVTVANGLIAFRGPLRRGANTRKAGEDIREGTVALAAGRRLTPADLALLSAIGVARVRVHRPLRVAILSTGDELADPGEPAGPDRIFDANRPMLLSLTRRLGHAAVDLGRVGDDRAALRRQFDLAADSADLVITSGGASAGDEDHVSALLREAGALREWRIAIKPGRPLALAMWNGIPVFGLPGNPVAAMICALVFAGPAMNLMAGAGWSRPQGFDIPAAFEKRKKAGRREFLRARVRDGRAEVFASEGSGRISGLSWAEGLVELGDTARHVRPGDPVRYIPYGSFGL